MSISDDYHEIEAEIRYLPPAEGGRQTGVFSDYRGQFHYGGNDFDGFQFFPDLADGEMVELGTRVRVLVRFLRERWEDVHAERITVGMPFEIREGARVVGRGVVSKV